MLDSGRAGASSCRGALVSQSFRLGVLVAWVTARPVSSRRVGSPGSDARTPRTALGRTANRAVAILY
jgi:hypothetical protein